MRVQIKSILEILPFALVVESIVYLLLSNFKFYAKIFPYWEQLTECSFLMCIILYSISKDWGIVSKKCLLTLFLLNGLNFIYSFLSTYAYYFYFQSLIYSFGIFLIFYSLWKKK